MTTSDEIAACTASAGVRLLDSSIQNVLHEIISTDIHVDIYPIPPRDGHDYYTLVTMGMGAHRMNVPEDLDDQKLERAELLINLPSWWRIDNDSLEDERWYWPIRLLKSLARLPIRLDTWLGIGHTVMQEDCEPYAEDTGMCGSIILVPATFEDDSYVCKLPGGDEVNFYQVVPLYEDEVNLKLEKGVDKLVDLIPCDCLSVVNPGRPSYAGVDALDHGHEKDDDISDDDSKNETGVFTGFVLMSRISWSKRRLIRDLKEMWGIEAEEDDDDSNDDSLIFDVDGRVAAVSLMREPIPEGEAEDNAENNYMWSEAIDVAREHRAHLLVFVGEKDDDNLIERGKLFVKILAACCRQENASGIYTSGVVFQPEFYETMAEMMKEDELPIFNWIWFGLYRTEDGISGYTYGMRTFGREEIEVLNAEAEPDEVRNFLANLVSYQLECDVLLKDGETIGFSENDRHAISLSEGVALPGMTLKVSYSAAEIWMDDAECHLESIREKSLPVDEIAAYNHMAIYLRWCIEHGLMGEDFMEEHGEQVAGNDLRPFIRDVLGGRMDAGMFNSDGWGFARYYYNYCSELDSPHYPSDIDDHALRYFGPERYNSDEFKTEAYLFIPFDEEYYNDMAEVIGRRYANWKNQEIDPDTRDPSDLAKAIMEYLDCECQYFPSMKDDDPIMSAYRYARRLGVREGYVPVLVKVDEILWECLILNSDPDNDGSEDYTFDREKVRTYRMSMLSASVGGGRDILESLVRQRRLEAEDDDMDWDEEIVGNVQGGEGRDRLASYWNYETQMTDPMILAKIPVRNPWEIFAYLPFGNWNECPDTPELMATAKYWFERYDAVPAAMSHDELEFILPEPITEEDALDVAVEQYGLCPDMDQNHGTMGHLADELRQSTVWYFWWD